MEKNIRLNDEVSLSIEENRKNGIIGLDKIQRKNLGQFMTPASVANFMASLFSFGNEMRLLDAGAGTGSLSLAVIDRMIKSNAKKINIDAWEIDPTLSDYLSNVLNQYKNLHKNTIKINLHSSDFIEDATNLILKKSEKFYTHAILNPPYKKLNTKTRHRNIMKLIDIDVVNYYAGFVALCISLLAENGEVVAILPRSFCNGAYYRPFREFILSKCAIKQIHLFESRRAVFSDDRVLQETIIIHLKKGVKQGKVKISTSNGANLNEIEVRYSDFSKIVDPNDVEKFIRIPTSDLLNVSIFSHTLNDIGISVSTGPVVDFRVKKYLRKNYYNNKKMAPLLYPHHFIKQKMDWPKKDHRKPNAIIINKSTNKWLMPNGCYVIVRRFSSKEEKRRVKAYFVDGLITPETMIGFENHWNVLHFKKEGIDEVLAKGLCVYLNSTYFDERFRIFSGHTQVNATDLRLMQYPSRNDLIKIGQKISDIPNDQHEIDKIINSI